VSNIWLTIKNNILYIGWVQAILATGGSLFFSEILKYPPCVLCWYQRIAIYPMVVLFAVAIHRKSRDVFYYAMPLLIIGLLISIYHNLLYYGIIPDTLSPCSLGVSCTTEFIEYFGFVTIPFLALCSFAVMIVSLIIYQKNINKKNEI
jgi:disulfide bond formation protein DsbB